MKCRCPLCGLLAVANGAIREAAIETKTKRIKSTFLPRPGTEQQDRIGYVTVKAWVCPDGHRFYTEPYQHMEKEKP